MNHGCIPRVKRGIVWQIMRKFLAESAENLCKECMNNFKCMWLFAPKDNDLQIEVNDNVIRATSIMKILGIHIDSKLNFNGHIAFLCTKAGRQLNVLQRMRGVPRLCEQNGYLQQFHQSGTKPNLVAKILATNFGVFL